MFQKEVAERIIATFNKSTYGRLSILANWKLDVEKICDIKPQSFSPRPKIDSSLLFFTPKKNFFKLKNPKNLEKVTRIFFSQRRKMLKKPFNQLFNGDKKIIDNLKINLNLRPQNLDFETYYKLTSEYEKLGS
jgi:16S rRNA (adenine1518-N6/adenine1519-N6)-dimethyltransferase